ncbi:MAG: tRNA (adenosine(37)-N6)-dimethylallyltransferase MiaA [Terrimicrobiaceae bacterium]
MSHHLSTNNQLSTPLIICGPTGVGKTSFAVELASRFGGEILGADAFQVYSGLEILTAQPDAEQRALVPHHLIGFLPPSELFDAARFAVLAREKMAEITARGKRPVIVGGSGLYLKALTHGLADLPPTDPALRAELATLPLEELQRRLDQADPGARRHLDFQNPRRVMRALEIHLLTGRSSSELREEWKDKSTPGFQGVLLTRDRAELDARIADNVLAMFWRGVVAEVGRLSEVGTTAARAIGLREIQAFRRGELTESQCIAAITLATRRYAKRQLTWFRNQFDFQVIELTGLQNTTDIICDPALSGPAPV